MGYYYYYEQDRNKIGKVKWDREMLLFGCKKAENAEKV